MPRELGYNGGQYTKESHFGQVSDDFMMDEVKCKGTEEKLLDCPHTTEGDCRGNEGLGVICMPKMVEEAIQPSPTDTGMRDKDYFLGLPCAPILGWNRACEKPTTTTRGIIDYSSWRSFINLLQKQRQIISIYINISIL